MKQKILIILTLFTILVSSCWKCEKMYFKLTEVDNGMIPYKLGKTVNFIDSLGQPFVLTVNVDEIGWTSREECERTYNRKVSLVSEHSDLKIGLRINGEQRSSPVSNYIEIWISLYNLNVQVYYDKDGQFINTGNHHFRDCLEINNKIYIEVSEFVISKNTGYPDYKELIQERFLYNKTYGILQVEYNDKILFTIDNKDD